MIVRFIRQILPVFYAAFMVCGCGSLAYAQWDSGTHETAQSTTKRVSSPSEVPIFPPVAKPAVPPLEHLESWSSFPEREQPSTPNTVIPTPGRGQVPAEIQTEGTAPNFLAPRPSESDEKNEFAGHVDHLAAPTHIVTDSVRSFIKSKKYPCENDAMGKLPCFCPTCFVCGDHRNIQPMPESNGRAVQDYNAWTRSLVPEKPQYYNSFIYAPNMIGNCAWFAGHHVGASYAITVVRPDSITIVDEETGDIDIMVGEITEEEITTMRFSLPTMLLTRPNITEHFNAGVQNRIWVDYRHWYNVVSTSYKYEYTISSDVDPDNPDKNDERSSARYSRRSVEQFSIGLEKQFLQYSSVEVRVPILFQFASGRAFELGEKDDLATSVELGNISIFQKQVLRQGPRWTISGGTGLALPTAKDWQLSKGDLAKGVLKNEACYFVAFLGTQWHPNPKTFGHFVVQADIPLAKNELVVSTNQGNRWMKERVNVSGQQVIRTGLQLGRWVYINDQGRHPRRLGIFAEVNYAAVMRGTSGYKLTATEPNASAEENTVYLSAFGARSSTLSAALGMPMEFGKLTVMNSLILPIPGYDRPFDVGYNVSLTRRF